MPDPDSRRTFPAVFQGLARVLLVGFCVTVVAQQTDMGSLAFGDECRDRCPDDEASHRCPLNCMSCSCVGHGTPVSLTLHTPAVARPVFDRARSDEPKRLSDPRTDSIFHVPRSILL